jgi:phosphatidylserine/phosphatidylglycerophosphate/cardiolipin synthase-like enzyme
VDFVLPRRAVPLSLVSGRGHYETVIEAVRGADLSVWISTANLKELMVEDPRAAPGRRRGGRKPYRSILGVFDELHHRKVDIRILHAAPPSRPFRAELARHPRLVRGGLQMRACPRVHFKAVIVDGAFLYLGSANWTGAGLGAKGEGRRNFELGVVTDDAGLLDEVQGVYERVWRGSACGSCKLREMCPAPLDKMKSTSAPPPPSSGHRP